MDTELYDEFGNYIGPEIDSDSDSDVLSENNDETNVNVEDEGTDRNMNGMLDSGRNDDEDVPTDAGNFLVLCNY